MSSRIRVFEDKDTALCETILSWLKGIDLSLRIKFFDNLFVSIKRM